MGITWSRGVAMRVSGKAELHTEWALYFLRSFVSSSADERGLGVRHLRIS